jgi:Domain of unknown function (DUF3361)
MDNMLHTEVDSRHEESSDWQSYSETSPSGSSFQNLGVDASTRTLNFSLVDPPPPAHESSNVVSGVRPLLAHRAAQSIESSPNSQSTSPESLEPFHQHGCKRLVSSNFEPPFQTPFSLLRVDASRPIFILPTPTYYVPSTVYPATFAGMDTVNVPELVERLGSDEDAVRKMAVFKLQSNIGDPSFAEIFIQEGGLQKLKYLAMHASGNTLAYSLTSFSRLLEVDKGWDFVEQDLIERVGIPNQSAYTLHG